MKKETPTYHVETMGSLSFFVIAGNNKTVCRCKTHRMASKICTLLNAESTVSSPHADRFIHTQERLPTGNERNNLIFLEYPSEPVCGIKHIGWYSEDEHVFEDDISGEQYTQEYVPFWMPIPDTCALLDEYVNTLLEPKDK